ncbi:Activity-regulated cytoskeleton-associated protein [Folsomia candida]|uniref:Activity-regulated cytoskeleton-associated protein n=1 Tax=Folsomia candida TaxID=158441 RepID=A0A226EB09_FOLCA|nr:Activity-regulated cytoskeleton-associated protein [Folsomia candida]
MNRVGVFTNYFVDFFATPPPTAAMKGSNVLNTTTTTPTEEAVMWHSALSAFLWILVFSLIMSVIGYCIHIFVSFIFSRLHTHPVISKILRKISRLGEIATILTDFNQHVDENLESLNFEVEYISSDTARLLLELHAKVDKNHDCVGTNFAQILHLAPKLSDLEHEVHDNLVRGHREIEGLSTRLQEIESFNRDEIQYGLCTYARDYINSSLHELPNYVRGQLEHFAPKTELDTAVEYWSTSFDRMETSLQSQIRELKAELEKIKISQSAPSSLVPPANHASSSAVTVQSASIPKILVSSQLSTTVMPPLIIHPEPPKVLDETFSSDSSHPYQPETSTHGNTVVFHSGGNLPVPKFVAALDSPENFMRELELYMKRKRVMSDDWVLMLPSIFNQDKDQNLWWQSTKLSVSNWSDFRNAFMLMYGSTMTKHQSLERLLNRRQRVGESFSTFAFEMNMAYRKIFELSPDADVLPILQFIAERALPHLKSHLLSCRSANLVEMVNFGKLFESEKVKSYSSNHATTSHSSSPPASTSKPNYSKHPSPPSSENKGKAAEGKKVVRICSQCPGKSNHDDAHCYKLHPPPKQQGKVAQVVPPKSGNSEK